VQQQSMKDSSHESLTESSQHVASERTMNLKLQITQLDDEILTL